jgi:hypothetical protein
MEYPYARVFHGSACQCVFAMRVPCRACPYASGSRGEFRFDVYVKNQWLAGNSDWHSRQLAVSMLVNTGVTFETFETLG